MIGSKKVNRTFVRRVVYGCLCILWCVLIFAMSHESAPVSAERSSGLTRQIVKLFVSVFGGDIEDIQLLDNIEFLLRKGAHMFLYFVLAVLSFLFVETFSFRRVSECILSLSFCLLYSMSDEIHQLFIEGRSGSVKDVLIDMTGAVIGVLFISLLFYTLGKSMKKL